MGLLIATVGREDRRVEPGVVVRQPRRATTARSTQPEPARLVCGLGFHYRDVREGVLIDLYRVCRRCGKAQITQLKAGG